MKTPEQILGNHCPGFSALFLDKRNKAVMEMYTSILKAMKEYAYESVKDLKKAYELEQEHNIELVETIQELEDTLGLRNRSNPDLTID